VAFGSFLGIQKRNFQEALIEHLRYDRCKLTREELLMINRVGTVSLFVNDQNRAKDFYTRILGFELRRDEPLYPGATNRWVAVAPSGAETEIVLYLPDENWEHYRQTVGKSQALTFDVKDITALVAELKAIGVTFTQEPDVQPWGTYAMIQDSEGNQILLVEPPKQGS
jgi:catechol 2,3-dioxygenase-like lactoylglutathione lyase family enzyme